MTKYVSLTIHEKIMLIDFAEKKSVLTHAELVTWTYQKFKKIVERSTISKILKHKTQILSKANGTQSVKKRIKTINYPNVDVRLYEWFLDNESRIPMTEAVLVEQATSFAHEMGKMPPSMSI
jgi:hypothetical protein